MRAGGIVAGRQGRGQRDDARAEAGAAHAKDRAYASPTVTVHVPLAFRQRRGRKVLVAPDGAEPTTTAPASSRQSSGSGVTPALRALARAFRWRTLLETGAVATVLEIAAAEKINPSYVSRVLRLTLLSPEVVEAVMAGAKEADAAPLDRLMLPFPIDWCRHTPLGHSTGGAL